MRKQIIKILGDLGTMLKGSAKTFQPNCKITEAGGTLNIISKSGNCRFSYSPHPSEAPLPLGKIKKPTEFYQKLPQGHSLRAFIRAASI
jgi:hypothetical protein